MFAIVAVHQNCTTQKDYCSIQMVHFMHAPMQSINILQLKTFLLLLYEATNIKAPKCTLYSFIFQGQRSQGLNGLATAHCDHRRGSLLRRAHFESLRAAEAKNAATINHLISKRQSVLYFPYSTLFSRVKGHKGSPVLPRLLPSIVMGSLLRRAHFE